MSEETPKETPAAARKRNVALSPFTMYAASSKDPDKNLRLTFGVSATGFPFINADADENITERTIENNFGKLTARLGGGVFFSLLNLLKVAKSKEPGWKIGLQNFHNFVAGKRLDKPQHVNDVLIGTDNEGCVWISIVENGRDSARFFFGPGDWHNWKKADGESASRKEMNHYSVDGFVMGLGQAMSAAMGHFAINGSAVDERFPENKEAEQAGGNRPWQRQQGSGGNWNKGGGGSNWNRGGGGGNWNRGGGGGGNWRGHQGGGGNWKKGGNNWKGNQGGGNWNNNRNQNQDYQNRNQPDAGSKLAEDDSFEDIDL